MIEKNVKALKGLIKNLKEIEFRAVTVKNGVQIKLGEKINFIHVPDINWADKIMEQMRGMIKKNIECAELVIEHLEAHCEQLQMDLFKKEATDGET